MWFIKILIFLIGLALGWVCIRYNLKIVGVLGKSEWADSKFPGGTYSMWRMIGLLCIIAGFLFLVGTFDFVFFTS